jgi:hypothetical protein
VILEAGFDGLECVDDLLQVVCELLGPRQVLPIGSGIASINARTLCVTRHSLSLAAVDGLTI